MHKFDARNRIMMVGSSSVEPRSLEETWIPYMVLTIADEDMGMLEATGA